LIELKNLTKEFDKKIAGQNLSLKMEAGKITMLIGPSGQSPLPFSRGHQPGRHLQ